LNGDLPLAEYQFAAELRATLRRFLRRTEEIARAHDLTPQQHQLLLAIKGAADGTETSTVTQLSDAMQLRQSTVTELVDRAEQAGLVKRRPSSRDGRVVRLTLTPEGERRLRGSVAALAADRKQLVQLLDDALGHALGKR
jgi:DNA-binding MarR family transcriptional regulator